MKQPILQQYPDMFPEHSYMYGWPSGWDKIVTQLIHDVAKASDDVKVVQIKEKFAGLRFYYNGGNEEVSELVEKAEQESYKTCQNCGKEGKECISPTGWMRTLCESCDDD